MRHCRHQVQFVSAWGPESRSIKKLDGCRLDGTVDQGYPWIGGPAECIVLIVTQADIQNQIFEDLEFILNIQRPVSANSFYSQATAIGLLIITLRFCRKLSTNSRPTITLCRFIIFVMNFTLPPHHRPTTSSLLVTSEN